MRNKIVFILPSLSHPRHHKRINAVREHFDVEVYAFDRGLYSVNKLEGLKINYLGKMENKRYLRRLLNYIKIASVVRKTRDRHTLHYFFSLDFAFVASFILKRKTFIYEIGDFAYSKIKGISAKILARIDSRLIRNSLLTVLTSEGFLKYLLSKDQRLKESKFIVMPNKMPAEILQFERNAAKIDDLNALRFGFVGILRFANTVFRFIEIVAEKYPQHSFVFYGDGGLKDDFLKLKEKYSNLEYGGSFRNPDDLGKVYDSFDIHIGCYDQTTGLNQKVAEPNKLYESIYFGKPIIATENTFFGEKVKDLRIGFTIDGSTDDNIINFIESLDVETLNGIRENMLAMPSDELIINHEPLVDRIKEAFELIQ